MLDEQPAIGVGCDLKERALWQLLLGPEDATVFVAVQGDDCPCTTTPTDGKYTCGLHTVDGQQRAVCPQLLSVQDKNRHIYWQTVKTNNQINSNDRASERYKLSLVLVLDAPDLLEIEVPGGDIDQGLARRRAVSPPKRADVGIGAEEVAVDDVELGTWVVNF